MKHLGDITKLRGTEIEPVWCITGGSPCQDLSIAGKRLGLAGKRSGLFMEQIRVVKEMREHDKASGRADDMVRPRFMVWENVYGAFSSNGGDDFRVVVEECARISEPDAVVPRPPHGKWNKSGVIVGDTWSIAWRTHDAQYWGVPQRRRRVSLVADFGGHAAPEILFESDSLYGNSQSSCQTRKATPPPIENGFREASGALNPWDTQSNRVYHQNGVWHSLNANENGGQSRDAVLAYAIDPVASNSMKSDNPHSGFHVTDCAKTLDTSPPDPSKNQGGICILDITHANDVVRDCGQISPTLQSRMGTGGNQNPLTMKIRSGCEGGSTTYSMQSYGEYKPSKVAHTLKRSDDITTSNLHRTDMIVRRLTPLECTRLQGFPDGWVDIGEWRDSKGRVRQDSDTAKYKAIGNSIALPFWYWMFCRMARYLPANATLGSLFDGIGGFPLCWERIHGKGSARWASEIEEFPIAVTKKRFPENIES